MIQETRFELDDDPVRARGLGFRDSDTTEQVYWSTVFGFDSASTGVLTIAPLISVNSKIFQSPAELSTKEGIKISHIQAQTDLDNTEVRSLYRHRDHFLN